MISEATLRKLDFYFTVDHRARGRTFFIVSAAVVMAFGISMSSGFSENRSLWAASVTAIIVFWIRLRTYLYFYDLNSMARSAPLPGASPKAFFHSRRAVLFRIPTLVASFLLLEFIPKASYASALNSRIRKLLREDRRPEAIALADRGIQSGVPLDVDVLPITGVPAPTPQELLGRMKSPATGARFMAVNLGAHRTITVWRPVIVLDGRSLVEGALVNPGISLVGTGRDTSGLFVDGTVSALFRLSPEPLADTLFAATEVFCLADRPAAERFISVPSHSKRVVVYDVRISYLTQELDRVEWLNVQFDHCKLLIGGDQFELEGVVFQDCLFEFAEGTPEALMSVLQNSRGAAVSLIYPRARQPLGRPQG